MNTQNKGKPICHVYKDGTTKPKLLSLDEFDGAEKYICKSNEKLQLIPLREDRTVVYSTGASGSGKSYYVLQFLKEYRKKYPKNDIYLFSSLNEDETLDGFKHIKRINIKHPEFIDEEFTVDDFRDTCVIFDDTDCLTDKNIKSKVNDLLTMLLETGRHCKSTVIYTSHLPCKGIETKRILNEAHAICFFPRGLGGSSLDYLVNKQLGLSADQIKDIKKTRSRAVTFVKTYPNLLLFEKEARILS